MEGQEPGRNPGLIKGQQAASANGAVLMAPSFSEEDLEAGFSDWNDLASHDEVRKASVSKELAQALQKAFGLQDVLARHLATGHQSSVPSTEEDYDDAFDRENEARGSDENISSGVTVQNEQEIFFSLGKNGVNEHVRTTDGRFVVREAGEKLGILNEDHQGITPEKNIVSNTETPEEARVYSGEAEQEPGWVLSSGDLQKGQKPVPPIDKNRGWDFRIGKNGVIEHFRSSDGRIAVRETGDKIQILDQDYDALALALERALESFGTYLHFDGNQAGARILVDIIVTRDVRVTFTDDRLNAQIQLRRVHSDLDRGRPILSPEREQTSAQKHGAGASASELTPEKKQAVQPDGKLASQHAGEVFVDAGAAPYDFDKRNELNYFVRTVTPQGEHRIYWGKDLPRALEEAGAKVGDSITATRVASKPVTVEEIQEQPDGSRQTVRIDAKRNSWQVDNYGVDREAVIKAYDTLVKSPEDRKKLEITVPLLVAARDQAVVELKREKIAAELAQRNSQNHTLRL
jgi:hypothetical protein